MKKITSILGCSILCLTVLVGCGNNTESTVCKLDYSDSNYTITDTVISEDDKVIEFKEVIKFELSEYDYSKKDLEGFKKQFDSTLQINGKGVSWESKINTKKQTYTIYTTIDATKVEIDKLEDLHLVIEKSKDGKYISKTKTIKKLKKYGSKCK